MTGRGAGRAVTWCELGNGGAALVSSSRDHSVIVWDTATGPGLPSRCRAGPERKAPSRDGGWGGAAVAYYRLEAHTGPVVQCFFLDHNPQPEGDREQAEAGGARQRCIGPIRCSPPPSSLSSLTLPLLPWCHASATVEHWQHGGAQADSEGDWGRHVISAGEDGCVRVFDLLDGQESCYCEVGRALTCLTKTQDDSIVAAGDVAGRLHLFSLQHPPGS